jgi:hypothetical protein
MKFKYPEYEQFFCDLLCEEGEDLSKYASLFDLREPPSIKRRELRGHRYTQAWEELEKKFGRICQLQFVEGCEINNPVAIDHVIPISSNVLNKHLRKSEPSAAGKKVPTESFGSNDISNLVLACAKCNSNKKHRFLDRERIQRILKSKGF